MKFGALLLLGVLAIHQVMNEDDNRQDAPGGNVEVTRYSLSLMHRELFSFSITKSLDKEEE